MKKVFTLISVALIAMSASAQSETWDAATVSDMSTAEQTIEATANVTVKVASFLNEKDIQDGQQPWSFGEATNTALNTDACDPQFTKYLKGKGNPYAVDNGGSWEETDNGPAWRDDPNATVWTPGCGLLPVHGNYTALTTKAAGTMKVGVYVNKGNHATYVIDADTKESLPNTAMEVSFYYQNNGFTFDDNGTLVGFITGTMPDDYIIQHTNGYSQGRPALGYIEFPVEANKTYYLMNPKSQLGIYGFRFTPSAETGISTISSNAQAADAPIFNLAGQRVSKDYKGVVIQNGVKKIQK